MRRVTNANAAHPPWNSNSGKNDQATRDRTNRSTLPKLGDRGQRCRVDGELAVVRNGLDHEDPGICAPKPTTDRSSKADVVARIAIILRQQLRPIGAQPHAFPSDHRRVEVGLQQTCACPPDVEIPVTAGFQKKKHADDEADEHHGQGRCFRTVRIGQCQS
jgi:hypothetical protein